MEPRNQVSCASLRRQGRGGGTEPTRRIGRNCEPTGGTERAGMETLLLSSSGESGRSRRGLRAEPRHGRDTGEHGRSRSLPPHGRVPEAKATEPKGRAREVLVFS